MFNRDALFGKKDDLQRSEARTPVNVTPGLSGNSPPRSQPLSEPAKPDLRFAELPKNPPSPPRTEEPASASRLIVGHDIKLRGVEITDCDTLVVEGRVEASMDSRVIQIAENGVFAGTVSIDIAEIRGRFEGELTARKQLVIHSTGRVTGQIRYGKIRIEEGGELSGDVSTLTRVGTAAVKEISLTGAAPSTPAPSGSPASSSSGQSTTAPNGLGATANSARTGQTAGAAAGDTSTPATAALRQPAPSRGPRTTSRSNTGANT